MKTEKIQKLIELRTISIKDFHRRKDWKSNKNAIMREIEHVELLNETKSRSNLNSQLIKSGNGLRV